MKKITIQTDNIMFKNKVVDRGLLLTEFETLRNLKYNPVYVRNQSGEFISKYNRKKKGIVYVPITELDNRSIYFMCVDNAYFKFALLETGLNYISILVDVITRQGIRKAIKKYNKK